MSGAAGSTSISGEVSGAEGGSGASVATVGSVVALGCLWMLSLADFLCFLPVRPRPRLRGISVHATAARRTRRGRLLDGDLQQDGAHVKSVVADASGLARGRGVYREAGLPNTFGAYEADPGVTPAQRGAHVAVRSRVRFARHASGAVGEASGGHSLVP